MHQLHGLITVGAERAARRRQANTYWSDDADAVAGSNQPVRADRKPETDAGVGCSAP